MLGLRYGAAPSKGDSMHVSSVRPQTKFAAALVAAGVVSAATIVGVPENRGIAAIDADVANASVITDLLYGLGDAVNAAASGVAYAFDGVFSLPFDAVSAIAIAAQNPSLSPNLLSWLVNRYVNPADSYLYWSYPWAIKDASLEPLAGLLPGGQFIINGLNQFADAINNTLAGLLPDPGSGADATDAFWGSDVGRIVVAANQAVTAPVWMLYNTAYYLGYLPADLEATFESAIRNPSQIPGLVSNLVYDLLSPTYGLLGDLLNNITAPLRTLPGPIGDLSTALVQGIGAGINDLLSLLPTPISPNPFPSALRGAPLADESAGVTSLPEASLAVTGGVSLPSADPIEKKLAATGSDLNTSLDTLQDAPPAADDNAPDATPAADDADGTEVTADKPLTNTVKSGNKVSPGDKFVNQIKSALAKGETVKGGTTTSTPADGVTAAAPEGPTAPQTGETEGAEGPDSGAASGAAA